MCVSNCNFLLRSACVDVVVAVVAGDNKKLGRKKKGSEREN
jgi:hypothetical protein